MAIYFAVSMFLRNFAAEFGALCAISSKTFYLLTNEILTSKPTHHRGLCYMRRLPHRCVEVVADLSEIW